MTRIEQDLTFFPKILSIKKSPYQMTYIDGTVTNTYNNLKTYSIKNFIVDTGAAITILNSTFNFLFTNDTPVIDTVNIQYGGNLVKLPVYEVLLKIKGEEFTIPAAFDKKMPLTSLLGHYGFLNTFEHFGISSRRKKFTLIK